MEHIKFSGFVKAEYPHSDNCRVIFPPNSIGFFVFVPYVWHCTRPLFINHILLQFQYIQSQAELSSLRLSTLKYVASKIQMSYLFLANYFFYPATMSLIIIITDPLFLSIFLLLLLYHFSVAKTRCKKSLLYEKYTINYLAKKYKKKRIYHNCAELVR